MAKTHSFADCSPQQLQILNLQFNGLSQKQIAVKLGINMGALNTQFCKIREKLDVDDNPQIFFRALKEKWYETVAALTFSDI